MKKLHSASKPNLSFIILAFFLVSFAIARVFTAFFPSTVLMIQGFHIHHFWYGLALLVIGGWLGINYQDDHTERIAAIIFGIGGGLVGDEIGLLITFGDYYSELTFTFLVSLIAFAFLVTLLRRHSATIIAEFLGLFQSNIDLYFGIFLVFVSAAFLIQSGNMLVVILSAIAFLAGIALVLERIARFLRPN